MTKREKQLQLVRNRISRMEASREAAIKMLVRATTELPKLRKEESRLMRVPLKRQRPGLFTSGPEFPPEPEPQPNGSDPGELPTFLRRGMAAQKAVDGVISEETKRLAALPDPRTKEKKAERRVIEKEVREAELTGKRRRWPATGKAALAQLK